MNHKSRWAWAAGAALLLLAAAGLLWRGLAAPAPGLLRTDDAQLLERGRQVYASHCASCHGAQGEGQAHWQIRNAQGLLPAPPHDPSGHTWHHADALLFQITKHGVAQAAGLPDYASSMPAFRDTLNDADIVAALSWIKSRWPSDIQARQEEINRQALAATR